MQVNVKSSATGVNNKPNELLDSKFVMHYRRSELSAMAEGCFAAITLLFGVSELVVHDEYVCGYCLICASSMFLCLFMEFYWGVVYNCWPLLICHAAQSGGLCLSIFVLMMCSMLLSYPGEIAVLSFRLTMRITVSTGIIVMVLLATFAVSSYYRARELWSFEHSHVEHLKRLLIDALETLEDLRHEQHSLTSNT